MGMGEEKTHYQGGTGTGKELSVKKEKRTREVQSKPQRITLST